MSKSTAGDAGNKIHYATDAPAARSPRVGDFVLYTLSAHDAAAINARRSEATDRAMLHAALKTGAVIHSGNLVEQGQVFPAIIVRVWGGGETAAFNVQVLLDGQDTFWATSTSIGIGHGKCAFARG